MYFLNSVGVIYFDRSPCDALQIIPAEYALNRRLFDQPMSEIQAHNLEMRLWGIESIDDLIRRAPATSIAGIAKRIGVLDEFKRLASCGHS